MDTSDIKVEISENSECVEETAPEIADEEIKTDPDVINFIFNYIYIYIFFTVNFIYLFFYFEELLKI